MAEVRRWVPTVRKAVARDGSAYAYIEYVPPGGDQRVHVVDTGTGADRTLVSGSDLDLPAFLASGIYLVHHRMGADGGRGLVRLDPATGNTTELPVPEVRLGPGWVIEGGAAWAWDFSPSTDLTQVRPPRAGGDRLRRYDVVTGAVTTWYQSSGHPVSLSGVDVAGHPIVTLVQETGAAVEVDLLTSPLHQTPLWAAGSHIPIIVGTGTDARGTWILTQDAGVWLLPPGATAPQAVSPMNRYWEPAGACQ